MRLPLWLILLLVGLSQISESIYTPSLPDIGRCLGISDATVEHTLTIYLLGFAFGVLFWGRLSDRHGRRPGMIMGLVVFVLGSVGCYLASSITFLMVSRFVQAFGASIGSVLTQAACRDAFKGPELGRAYAIITGSLGVFPAIGPVVGGYMAEYWGWHNIFVVLALWGIILALLVSFRMPETHQISSKPSSVKDLARRLIKDQHVWACAFIVGISNGMYFSYFAEAPFYMMDLLKLSPSRYGLTFVAIALSMLLGGYLGPKVQKGRSSTYLMSLGLKILLVGSSFFVFAIVGGINLPNLWLIGATVLSQMILVFGMCMVNAGALSMALLQYKDCTGTASSLFGFTYYVIVSLVTLGMGFAHNDTLYAMPLYFWLLALAMWQIRRWCQESVSAS